MKSKVIVTLWRRGRGLQDWEFVYYSASSKQGFTAPGWYHDSGKGRLYRLTIDHHYPAKPVWLGYKDKKSGRWVNTEGLYEPIIVAHPKFTIVTKGFGNKRRSKARVSRSASVAELGMWWLAKTERIKGGAQGGSQVSLERARWEDDLLVAGEEYERAGNKSW